MIKAKVIRNINPEEFKYLTKNRDNTITAWNAKPSIDEDYNDWLAKSPCRVYNFGKIKIKEFRDKIWQECLIEFGPSYDDMIGCVGWFWDEDKNEKCLGVLTNVDLTKYRLFVGDCGNQWFHFCPAKPEELKFYEG